MQIRINWKSFDTMRILRLALGAYIIVQGVQDKQWSFVLLGAGFLLMSLFGVGCCAGGSCFTTNAKPKPSTNQSTEDIVYEEVR